MRVAPAAGGAPAAIRRPGWVVTEKKFAEAAGNFRNHPALVKGAKVRLSGFKRSAVTREIRSHHNDNHK